MEDLNPPTPTGKLLWIRGPKWKTSRATLQGTITYPTRKKFKIIDSNIPEGDICFVPRRVNKNHYTAYLKQMGEVAKLTPTGNPLSPQLSHPLRRL